MKLILNGGGDGNQVKNARELLNSLIDHSKKILYIPLAWVDSNYDSCLEFITKELSDVQCAGVDMVRSGNEIDNLSDYACIYIGGGNTYKLLSELKSCGAFDKIKDYLLNGGIVYGGSAGAIIFGKDLDSCNTDDTNEVGLVDNSGFDLMNGYSLLCHYTNRDEERTLLSKNYLLELSKKKSIYAIPEEDTIFIDDDNVSFLGNKPYYIFSEGNVSKYYVTPLIETERLILKRAPLSDYLKVYEYDFTKLRNINNEFEFVKLDPKRVEGFEEIFEESYDWIVYLKDGMIPISNIVADREREEINSIELAFNTHPDYWRSGYTSEAIIGIMKFLFDNGYDNIICGYDEGNFKSKGIGEKLGFVPYEIKENAWVKNGVPITSYITIMSKERFYEKYR